MSAEIDISMSGTDCTAFLQWALPQLELRWPGYRKVQRQVCNGWGKADIGVKGQAAEKHGRCGPVSSVLVDDLKRLFVAGWRWIFCLKLNSEWQQRLPFEQDQCSLKMGLKHFRDNQPKLIHGGEYGCWRTNELGRIRR